MHFIPRLVLVAVLSTVVLPAQRKLDARSFLPPDYNGAVHVDMKRIVDSDMWDPVERSMFRVLLARFRSEMGFDIADLDSIRYAIRMTREEDGTSERLWAWIFEGSERVDLARMPEARRAGYEESKQGGVTWLHDEWGTELISPRPGLLVIGSDGIVGSILREEAKSGLPDPELQALTAGARAFASIAVILPPPDRRTAWDLAPIPAEWFTEEDDPLALRVRLAGDAAADAVALEMLLQFENGDVGPQRFEDSVRALCASLPDIDKALTPIATLLGDLQFRRAGRELEIKMPLGDPETAANRLVDLMSKLLPAALFVDAGEVPAAAVAEVRAEAAPAPEKPAVKKEEKK